MTTKTAGRAASALALVSPSASPVSEPRLLRTTSGALTFNGSADELVAEMRPAEPVHIMRPDLFEAAGREFIAGFSGTPMYAVKCNPDKVAIQSLYRSGIRSFDVASIGEVRLVK